MEKLWGEGSAAKQDVLRRDNGIRAAESKAGGLFLPFSPSFFPCTPQYLFQGPAHPILPQNSHLGLSLLRGKLWRCTQAGTCILGKAF